VTLYASNYLKKHLPVNWFLRYFVVRTALSLLLAACLFPAAGFAQEPTSSSSAGPKISGIAPDAPDSSLQDVSQQVIAAESAISKSDWASAEAKLSVWIASHPGDSRALFDAGYVADAQNRLDAAANLYRRAIAANPKSFEAHLSLGLLLARQGKQDDARAELVTATALDPGPAGPTLKARAWRALAEIDRPDPGHPGDADAATNELLEALKLSPETPEDTLLAANLAEQSGQYDAAAQAYGRLLEKDPGSEPANAGMAHLLIAQKKYAEAETFLRAAMEKLPDDPALTAQLATVLTAQDKAEALPLLQKLHAAHPENTDVTGMLAEVLGIAGDVVGSDKLYVQLLAASPNDADLLVAHGQNLVRMGKDAEAVAVFDKATRFDPSNSNAWSGLAFSASKINQPTVTLHALSMRSKILPENASTYFLWATSYDRLHQRAQAVAYYRHFLEAAAGKFPDQEWQARQRLQILQK
jgi:tetratricopeptide (TPR) repeat protein